MIVSCTCLEESSFLRVPPPLAGATCLPMAAPPAGFWSQKGVADVTCPSGGLTELGKPGTMGALILALKPLCSRWSLVTRPLMHSEGEVPAPHSLCGVFVFCLILQKDCKALTPGFNPRDRTQVSNISCLGRWVLYH